MPTKKELSTDEVISKVSDKIASLEELRYFLLVYKYLEVGDSMDDEYRFKIMYNMFKFFNDIESFENSVYGLLKEFQR